MQKVMTTTIARPILKKQARKVQSLNQVSKHYYEVVGDTGNLYQYDSLMDCCNCKAGQNGMDCYHAKAVRDHIEYEILSKTEYLVGIPTTDIGGMIRDLGLTAKFKGLAIICEIWGGQQTMLIEVYHKDYFLCEIHCINKIFIITNHLTGRSKTHCPKSDSVFEALTQNLKRLRNSHQYWLDQEAKNALLPTGNWGEINAGL
jgi:hypothetical protein